MGRLLLIRHGQSEWNALGRWQGQADPPLTDLGRQQAIDAARRVGAVDAIVSSPLTRALDTALIVSNDIGVGPVVVVDGLVERHAGEWQGLTRPEIHERYPGYLESGRRPDGWEDDGDLAARVMDAIGRIAERFTGGEVLAISHAGVLYAVADVLGEPIRHGRLANLGGLRLDHTPSGWRVGEVIDLLDDDLRTVPGQI